MPPFRRKNDPGRQVDIVAEARRDQAKREEGYREQALRLFPHVCARCCREFSGKRLRELTVHHKDNDHMNNPPDGSNWELLCLYCHDDAHQSYEKGGKFGQSAVYSDGDSTGFNPFGGLKDMLKVKEGDSDSSGGKE